MGLLVAGIGIYLASSLTPSVRKQRLIGIMLAGAGVAYTAFATYILIPAFGGRADYYWAYSTLGNNVPQVIAHIIRHPLGAVRMMITPRIKLDTLTWLFAVFCFLPLLSPIVIAALPLLAERMLNSRYRNWWLPHFHYNAYLVVILACAAVDGAARLDRWASRAWNYFVAGAKPAEDAPDQGAPDQGAPAGTSRSHGRGVVALGCCLAILAATMYALPKFQLGQALHAKFYAQTSRSRAAAAADAAVPDGVLVEAADSVGPELSGRDTVLLWDGEHPPLGTPWIVADVRRHEMTFASVAAQRDRLALLLRSDYQVVFQRDGYVVLHRASLPAARSTSQKAVR